MKRRTVWIFWGTVGGLLVALAGFLLATSGLIPIRASDGHWAVTEWILQYGKRRSIATNSIFIEPPDDLRDPGLVMRGAGHYSLGCQFCHGAPGRPRPPVAAAMTPPPPRLQQRAHEMSARELFYTVKHGIKFTGMPAWPALRRDDEVWAVVAFLLELRHLDERGYQHLITPDQPTDGTPAIIADVCARCHGVDGLGRRDGAFPRLAGQRAAYLRASLDAYAARARPSGIMEPIAVLMTEDQVEDAVRYYAELPPMQPTLTARSADGERIALEGVPRENLPACASCHGPAEHPLHEGYPILAGQQYWYLRDQLELFRAGHRGGARFAHLMHETASHRLSDEQIHAVSLYYASLPPPPLEARTD